METWYEQHATGRNSILVPDINNTNMVIIPTMGKTLPPLMDDTDVL
jgi:hypothetical protein